MLIALLLMAFAERIAHGQDSPFPVVVTMEAPATAVSGQEISYVITYHLEDVQTTSATAIIISIPQNTTYVSSALISGTSGTFGGLDSLSVRWGVRGTADEPYGQLRVVVRIDEGFVGTIHGGCYIPGTMTSNPRSHCEADTTVEAPSTLPDTGSGGKGAGSGHVLFAFGLLGLAGVALAGAGVTARRPAGRR